ncbi:MAG: winged helix-turn-helix transcriptional regulator [Spirochaetales bacterium]|nr:winged helix-turn-helix transcriptional regulator [Spirochaetales bacterium]
MNDTLLKTYREQAALHKLLANESRLAIIDKLNSSEANVSELTKITGLDQSTVSKHLSLLYNAGLIDYRKSGNQIFYKLITTCVIEMTQCALRVSAEKSGCTCRS